MTPRGITTIAALPRGAGCAAVLAPEIARPRQPAREPLMLVPAIIALGAPPPAWPGPEVFIPKAPMVLEHFCDECDTCSACLKKGCLAK